ncbi:hypothetical protein [Frigoribacterium sp. UYMn621]|uniref:hypothetical protein n=1 Tax=Frigoribacterium sp. UYMn621 TaxID=3156343 RepID=UPI003399027F
MIDPQFSTPRGTFGERARFLFATPWWRALWLIGALVWGVGSTIVTFTDPNHNPILGPLSVIPIFALAWDVSIRSARIEKRATAQAEAGPPARRQGEPD